ncbi:DUF1048 domain-containing protein [Listeria aquatica]|uniref:DNA-binding ferritin-like protein (Dps family) n=1 Tax=Listeria aquatica FSL S10-1188 TaxID=1265818 RepID=W7AUX9_9LIST|nr:DUF1048 domain-containing protein [Listeria aquatica]EUJ17457.1 hypothetical protein MAQA_13301 [Listeria aquatica FSL S10-1188]
MNFWDRITGNDITRDLNDFKSRVEKLPDDYQAAWEEITLNLMGHADFTGRNLIPILGGVLSWFEETAADGQHAQEILGNDIKGFCVALASEEGAKSLRDKWRDQLNKNVAKKLNQ